MTERETYSLLDWLGDIGGLLEALMILSGVFVGPVAAFALKEELLSSIFRYVRSLVAAEPEVSLLDRKELLER